MRQTVFCTTQCARATIIYLHYIHITTREIVVADRAAARLLECIFAPACGSLSLSHSAYIQAARVCVYIHLYIRKHPVAGNKGARAVGARRARAGGAISCCSSSGSSKVHVGGGADVDPARYSR